MTMQKPRSVNSILSDAIAKLDVDAVGIASVAQWKGTKLEETALRLLPGTKSVVVLAMEVYSEVLDLASIERTVGSAPYIDLLARNADFLSGRLTKAAYDIAKASHNAGLKALPLPAAGCPIDGRFMESVFSYKHAGQAAGLGKIGWSSLLITPRFGPRVRLSCCLTEAELEPTKAELELECTNCGICIESCPANALSRPQNGEPYAINKFACSAYRNAGGGCSECMRLCPASS
ncbi:MAG: epoxyqueuosine reductase [Chloroflexi bacterium]|nr:epoxyqueuosine reductase [Chloroflexota bacterium]